MIQAMFDGNVPEELVEQGFGVYVTEENVDEVEEELLEEETLEDEEEIVEEETDEEM